LRRSAAAIARGLRGLEAGVAHEELLRHLVGTGLVGAGDEGDRTVPAVGNRRRARLLFGAGGLVFGPGVERRLLELHASADAPAGGDRQGDAEGKGRPGASLLDTAIAGPAPGAAHGSSVVVVAEARAGLVPAGRARPVASSRRLGRGEVERRGGTRWTG